MPILLGILALVGAIVLGYVLYQGVLKIDEELAKVREYHKEKKKNEQEVK